MASGHKAKRRPAVDLCTLPTAAIAIRCTKWFRNISTSTQWSSRITLQVPSGHPGTSAQLPGGHPRIPTQVPSGHGRQGHQWQWWWWWFNNIITISVGILGWPLGTCVYLWMASGYLCWCVWMAIGFLCWWYIWMTTGYFYWCAWMATGYACWCADQCADGAGDQPGSTGHFRATLIASCSSLRLGNILCCDWSKLADQSLSVAICYVAFDCI